MQYKYGRILAEEMQEHERYFEAIYNAASGINAFLSGLFRQPLWVEPEAADGLAKHGMKFMESFCFAAHYALNVLQTPRFKIPPKLHMLAHFCHKLYSASQARLPLLNFLSSSCQMDEDFIGKIAFQSRQVSIRTVHRRSIQRYLVNLAIRW